jgi:hypothetical protein
MSNLYTFALPDADALNKAKPETMDAALKLVAAFADAKTTKATLEKLAAATEAHRAAKAEADERLAEVERREASLQKRLDDEASDMARARAEHARRMADEKRDHEEGIAARVKDLEQREKAAAEAHARNVELHADLEKRLALVRQAAV